MVKSKDIMRQLNQTYIDLLTDAPWFTYERTLELVVSEIISIVNIPYVSIVIQKNWNNVSGLMIEKHSSHATKNFRETCTKEMNRVRDEMNVFMSDELIEEMYTLQINDVKKSDGIFHMVPLVISNITRGYLMLVYEKDQYTKAFIDQFSRSTEQLLITSQWIADNRQMNEKSSYLLEFTSKLYTCADQASILKQTIGALKCIYPDFTYALLLSQDHNADESLPIEMLGYSDQHTNDVSSNVYMYGKAQIEIGEHEESYLYTPLKGKQGVYGVLQIRIENGIQLPEQEVEFIKLFSNLIGESLENVLLYEDSKHLVSSLKLINDVTRTLNSNLNLSEIISVIKKQIITICSPTHIGFVYLDHEIEILQGSATYFYEAGGKSLIKEMLIIARKQRDGLFKAHYKSEIPLLPLQSVMSFPMFYDGKLTGLIIIGHENTSAFSFSSFKIMRALIQNMTLALTNSILTAKLEQAVITDDLTKLYARNFLDRKTTLHMKKDVQGSLILFDVDDFKHINDSYGHQVGDKVLIQVANILKANTRDGDVAARWGGEELALYLPNASLDEAVMLARRISDKVEHGTQPGVTLSSGVSSWDLLTIHNVDTLFVEADKSLYQAKKRGKNQVVSKRETSI